MKTQNWNDIPSRKLSFLRSKSHVQKVMLGLKKYIFPPEFNGFGKVKNSKYFLRTRSKHVRRKGHFTP